MLSIVIPAYNEINRLPITLSFIHRYLDGREYEVIVVDDGSTDGTEKLIYRERLIKLPANQGKGFAVKKGVLAANGDKILVMDADLATPLREMEKLLASECDIAIGSRALAGSKVYGRIKLRSLAGKVFPFLVRLITGLNFRDTQCGFKLFSKAAAHRIFKSVTSKGFAFDVEVLMLAREYGFSVEEIPIEWYEKPGSKVHVFKDGLHMLKEVYRFKMERGVRSGSLRPAGSKTL